MSSGGGGKKGGGSISVTDYFASIQYAICHGVVENLRAISVNDKEVAFPLGPTPSIIDINQPELFGGDKKEGGLVGRLAWQNGSFTQLLDAHCASKLGGSPATVPAYRGISTAYFTEQPGNTAGFKWSVNSPFVPPIHFRVTRIDRRWRPDIAAIPGDLDIDMNPAHIIRECLVDGVWGLGLPETALDNASFESSAERLYAERFGLSMLWARQEEIQNFIGDIISHIQGVVFVNPASGLITLDLIRDDYDVSLLQTFDRSNCTVESFKRRTPSETINEISVTWTNPKNEEEEVVIAQSLGAIVANGGEIVTDSRNYHGIRRAALASQVASRDLSAAVAPLAFAEITVNRDAWSLVPGQVCKLTYDEVGADELVMRVMSVNYGSPGASRIKVSLSEDVFGYTKPKVQDAPVSAAPSLSQSPLPPTHVEYLTANYYVIKASNPDASELVDPASRVGFMVATNQADAFGVEGYAEKVDATGASSFQNIGTFNFTGRTLITSALVPETYSTSFTFGSDWVGVGPKIGGFAIIGPTGIPESQHEIVLFTAVDDTAGWTIRRGLFDTIPQVWAINTPIRFVSFDSRLGDPEQTVIGVPKDYKFRTRTSVGLLPDADAVVSEYTPTNRYYRPARPANVTVAGSYFDPVNVSNLTNVPVTWATRNRLMEETVPLEWTETSVAPEAGQTTTVRLIDAQTGVQITQYAGLTGTSMSFPRTAMGAATSVRVRVLSVRDGIESLQAREIVINNGQTN